MLSKGRTSELFLTVFPFSTSPPSCIERPTHVLEILKHFKGVSNALEYLGCSHIDNISNLSVRKNLFCFFIPLFVLSLVICPEVWSLISCKCSLKTHHIHQNQKLLPNHNPLPSVFLFHTSNHRSTFCLLHMILPLQHSHGLCCLHQIHYLLLSSLYHCWDIHVPWILLIWQILQGWIYLNLAW